MMKKMKSPQFFNILTTHRNPKTAEYLLNNSNLIIQNNRNIHSILLIYAQNHNEKIVEIFNSNSKDLRMFNLLMLYYSNIKDYKSLLKVWKQSIIQFPFSKYSNNDAWAFVIESYCADFQKCKEALNHLESKIQPKSQVYESFIRVCGYNHQWEEALEIFTKKFPSDEDEKLGFYDAIIQASIDCSRPKDTELYWNQLIAECDAMDSKMGLETRPKNNTLFEIPSSTKIRKYHHLPYTVTGERIMKHHYNLENYEKVVEIFVNLYKYSYFSDKGYQLAAESYWNMNHKNIAQAVMFQMNKAGFKSDPELEKKYKEYRKEYARLNSAIKS